MWHTKHQQQTISSVNLNAHLYYHKNVNIATSPELTVEKGLQNKYFIPQS